MTAGKWERIGLLSNATRNRGLITWTFWRSRSEPAEYIATRTDSYQHPKVRIARNSDGDLVSYRTWEEAQAGFKHLVNEYAFEVVEPLVWHGTYLQPHPF